MWKMALTSSKLRTCCRIVLIILSVCKYSESISEPWINTIRISSKQCVQNKCKYTLNVHGGEFLGHSSWRLTSKKGVKGTGCDLSLPDYELRVIESSKWFSKLEASVPDADGKIYFCLHHSEEKNRPFGGNYVHQGGDLFLEPKNDVVTEDKDDASTQKSADLSDAPPYDLTHDTDVNYKLTRDSNPRRVKTTRPDTKSKREIINYSMVYHNPDVTEGTTVNYLPPVNATFATKKPALREDGAAIIHGLRIESANKYADPLQPTPSVLADTQFALRVFGTGLSERTVLAFTRDPASAGSPCKFPLQGEYLPVKSSVRPYTALYELRAPADRPGTPLYLCAKTLPPGVDPHQDLGKFTHQGTAACASFGTHTRLVPVWTSICIVLICLGFSSLFSGLNLGLMSLDRTDLKIISNTGTETERRYASTIIPVRNHGNYLLCSILLGNVCVNSTFTILLDDLTSGLSAIIVSTLAIVMFGEILPQAVCSRHGLMIGAKTICITRTTMCLTAPLSYPVSKVLDWVLGKEIGNVYNRERLKELVKLTTDENDLDKDEVNIISGALELRKKTVTSVMTKLEDVFMLPLDAVLDFHTMSEIVKSGYSRIPVYEGSRSNIVTVLFIKDLAFVDPDDETPLRTLCQFYQNTCNFVFEDVTLDVMFKQFKEGVKGHMAFVHSIKSDGDGDPYYETVGLVTLEDVIEEMIQSEIVDETDVFVDNRSKRLARKGADKLRDLTAFAEHLGSQRARVSPQLTLATFQFLTTSVAEFRPALVSEAVTRRLLRQDVLRALRARGRDPHHPSLYLYTQGEPVDTFVLVLEGRVEVRVGREGLLFESGPFAYFGIQALQPASPTETPTMSMASLSHLHADNRTFTPDYSVRAVTDLTYLSVKRTLYLAALRATVMVRNLPSGMSKVQVDAEIDKEDHDEKSNNLSDNIESMNDVHDERPPRAHGIKFKDSVENIRDGLSDPPRIAKKDIHARDEFLRRTASNDIENMQDSNDEKPMRSSSIKFKDSVENINESWSDPARRVKKDSQTKEDTRLKDSTDGKEET